MISLSMCYFSGIRGMAVSLWVIDRCFGLGGRSAPSFKLLTSCVARYDSVSIVLLSQPALRSLAQP